MRNGDGKPAILVVEDDRDLGTAIANLLEFEGYRSVVAQDGGGALDSIREHAFDAALIDVHLPDMNGLVLSHILRTQEGPEWPIVVISGDSSETVISNLATAGASDFIKKPLDPDLLAGRLGELLTRKA